MDNEKQNRIDYYAQIKTDEQNQAHKDAQYADILNKILQMTGLQPELKQTENDRLTANSKNRD